MGSSGVDLYSQDGKEWKKEHLSDVVGEDLIPLRGGLFAVNEGSRVDFYTRTGLLVHSTSLPQPVNYVHVSPNGKWIVTRIGSETVAILVARPSVVMPISYYPNSRLSGDAIICGFISEDKIVIKTRGIGRILSILDPEQPRSLLGIMEMFDGLVMTRFSSSIFMYGAENPGKIMAFNEKGFKDIKVASPSVVEIVGNDGESQFISLPSGERVEAPPDRPRTEGLLSRFVPSGDFKREWLTDLERNFYLSVLGRDLTSLVVKYW